jgi:hypothetical protein
VVIETLGTGGVSHWASAIESLLHLAVHIKDFARRCSSHVIIELAGRKDFMNSRRSSPK